MPCGVTHADTVRLMQYVATDADGETDGGCPVQGGVIAQRLDDEWCRGDD